MRVWICLLLAGCQIDTGLSGKGGNNGTLDSSSSSTDSNQTNTTVAQEECNGKDDDGDGEVDEGFPDEDANGRADCMDAECPVFDLAMAGSVTINSACEGSSSSPVADPWNVKVKWTLKSNSLGLDASASTPMIGNLDDDNGDGVIDENDTPEVVLNLFDSSYSRAAIVALDGATGTEKWSWSGAAYATGTAIADVDADGAPDVIGFDAAGHVVALDGSGGLEWTSTTTVDSYALPILTVADLDEDGRPEVLAFNHVLSGKNGKELWAMDTGGAPYAMAAVGDVDLDGDQEVAFAGKLYDSNGSLLWDSGETGSYGFWPIIIQADSDPEAEIGFVGSEWSLWEPDGTNIYRRNYGSSQPGPPCAADFDGDGTAEVAWGASATFVMYELSGKQVWSVPMDDSSGLAGCSGYDVDGTGGLEILFADQTTFKIFDGATGATNYTNTNHSSGTAFEYPSVADIDHDGHADILFVSNKVLANAPNALTVLEHNGGGWPASGSTWGIHDFAITNINEDGSVPQNPDPYWNKYNVYRARVASDHPGSPDLLVDITDVCVADCDYGPVAVVVWVQNQGAVDVPAGATVELYAVDAGNPRLVATSILPDVPAGTSLDGIQLDLSPSDVGTDGFRAVVDTTAVVNECDETNNEDDWTDNTCP